MASSGPEHPEPPATDYTLTQDDEDARYPEEQAAEAAMQPDPQRGEEAGPLDAKTSPAKLRTGIDAEELAGHSFAYQHDIALVDDVDLVAVTPGQDINWLEDVELLTEDGSPAVFDRYSNSFLKIYFPIPAGREDELARKVLITHLMSGSSYGIQLKHKHAKFAQPLLGSFVEGSPTVGEAWTPNVLEGWQQPSGH